MRPKEYIRVLFQSFLKRQRHTGDFAFADMVLNMLKDPLSGNKIPTCHRTAYESILNDSDYLSALKYADSVAKDIYESEAKTINMLQNRILSVVKNEKPYDVFIVKRKKWS